VCVCVFVRVCCPYLVILVILVVQVLTISRLDAFCNVTCFWLAKFMAALYAPSPLLDCGRWADDPVWKHLQESCRPFVGPLKILELCGGLGTAVIASRALLGCAAVESVGYYDVDPQLERVVRFIQNSTGSHSASAITSHLKCGPSGNILLTQPQDFPDAHAIIGGPPCPPWSGLGNRELFFDPRSSVFKRAIDIVKEKASGTMLLFFVLENVASITHQLNGSLESPADAIINDLISSCSGWSIELHVLNAKHFGLPQSRARAYIIGRRRSAFPSPPLRDIQKFSRRIGLGSLIDLSQDTYHGGTMYTRLQQQNLCDWKVAYHSLLMDESLQGQMIAVDISRTPSGRTSWGGLVREPDICQCLTARGPALHVIALGDGLVPSVDRPLNCVERLAIQGFPLSLASHCDAKVVVRAVGNAMAVSVVGSVIARELIAFVSGATPGIMDTVFGESSGSVSTASLSRERAFLVATISVSDQHISLQGTSGYSSGEVTVPRGGGIDSEDDDPDAFPLCRRQGHQRRRMSPYSHGGNSNIDSR
jgi:site-specific DNA-cytosine methylase